MVDNLRFVLKVFVCLNCNKRFKKLVHHSENSTECKLCGQDGAYHLDEGEFNRENFDKEYRIKFDENENSKEYHNKIYFSNKSPNSEPNQSKGNINSNPSITSNKNFNNRNLNPNNINQAGIYNQNYQNSDNDFERQSHYSSQRNNRNVFFTPFTVSPFSGSVHRQSVDSNDFFVDSIFTNFFGVPNQDFFQDNWSSNFSSNFSDPFTRIVYMQSMQHNQDSSNPPASKKAIKNLKRFKMEEKYAKKEDNKEIEYPACSICLNEIKKEEDTCLIPCGHMFHDKCINKWLDTNNTCPVCRFELPTDDPNYERKKEEMRRRRG